MGVITTFPLDNLDEKIYMEGFGDNTHVYDDVSEHKSFYIQLTFKYNQFYKINFCHT